MNMFNDPKTPTHLFLYLIPNIKHARYKNLRFKFIFKMESLVTCDSVSFWTILSLPTLILRVDKASLSSPTSHPINLAALPRPESKTNQVYIDNILQK